MLHQHASRLRLRAQRLLGKNITQQVLRNLEQAIDLILDNKVILNVQSSDSSDVEACTDRASTRQSIEIADADRSPSPAELSDISEPFEAQLSALVDSCRLIAKTENTPGRDGSGHDLSSSNRPEPIPSRSLTLKEYLWSDDVDKVLRDQFRMTGFRHNQREAINVTLAGKDVFVLMPTGGGKSLCYQLPAVVQSGKTQGVTLVICPLLSLIHDQLEHLKALHIPAATLNGETPLEDRRRVLASLKGNPEMSLLYITPRDDESEPNFSTMSGKAVP